MCATHPGVGGLPTERLLEETLVVPKLPVDAQGRQTLEWSRGREGARRVRRTAPVLGHRGQSSAPQPGPGGAGQLQQEESVVLGDDVRLQLRRAAARGRPRPLRTRRGRSGRCRGRRLPAARTAFLAAAPSVVLARPQVLVAAAVAHEVPGTAAHAAVAAVSGPAHAEVTAAVVALAARVAPAAGMRLTHVVRDRVRVAEAAQLARRLPRDRRPRYVAAAPGAAASFAPVAEGLSPRHGGGGARAGPGRLGLRGAGERRPASHRRQLLPEAHEALQRRGQHGHHLRQRRQFLAVGAAAHGVGVGCGPRERLQRGLAYLQVRPRGAHFHRVPLPRPASRLLLRVDVAARTGGPARRRSGRGPRDDGGALLREPRVELKEGRAGHGVVDHALVPQQRRERSPQSLRHGRTHRLLDRGLSGSRRRPCRRYGRRRRQGRRRGGGRGHCPLPSAALGGAAGLGREAVAVPLPLLLDAAPGTDAEVALDAGAALGTRLRARLRHGPRLLWRRRNGVSFLTRRDIHCHVRGEKEQYLRTTHRDSQLPTE